MITVGEFSNNPLEIRKKFWLEKLALPLQWQTWSEEELQDPGSLLKKSKAQVVLLSPEASDFLMKAATKKPAEVIESGFADSLVQQQNIPWLRCYLRMALRHLIIEEAPHLDTHSTCYITGSGAITRMCAVVAIQMGFKQLTFVTAEHHEASAEVRGLQKLFFDLDFKVLRENELTLQPNNGSLLINTLPAESGGVIYEDLTYLNFLKKDGLIADLPLPFASHLLLEEASQAQLRILPSSKIWGARDGLLLQSLLDKDWKLSLPQYLQEWQNFVGAEKQT